MNPAEAYIFNQPEPYRSILMHLQALVKQVVSDATLKYKWRIPVYYINDKPLCYLNTSHKRQYVDIGFWKGYQIQIHKEHHVTDNRKMVFSLRYTSLEAINETVFSNVLKEAVSFY